MARTKQTAKPVKTTRPTYIDPSNWNSLRQKMDSWECVTQVDDLESWRRIYHIPDDFILSCSPREVSALVSSWPTKIVFYHE